MYVAKFKQKFSEMSSRKRAIIREYCRLYEDTTMAVDANFDRIESIWQRAMGHPDLIACLELADYIYAEAGDHEIDGDKRAYLSEHLHEEVGLEPDTSEYIPIKSLADSCSNFVKGLYGIECQNGHFFLVEDYKSNLDNWTCSECDGDISRYETLQEGVMPDV